MLVCVPGQELKVMTGSVDEVHGSSFEVCFKFMENCRLKTKGFNLWVNDNPAEWLMANQAYWLQGPMCTPEQRDKFLSREFILGDSVLLQKVKGKPAEDNADCLAFRGGPLPSHSMGSGQRA